MSEKEKIAELEQQISELKALIFTLKPSSVSPNRRLQQIRQECREKYFGTWEEMKNGEVSYGPNGKTYSDYSVITDVINKITGLLFKYLKGKAGSTLITNLVHTEEDVETYRRICDAVCEDLLKKFDNYTEKELVN